MDMIKSYLINPLEIEVSSALLYFALAFIVYYFLPKTDFIKKIASRLGDSTEKPEMLVYLDRTIGFTFLGLIPGIVFPILFTRELSDYGANATQGTFAWLWWVIPVVVFVSLYFIRPAKKVNIDFYPQVRKENWNLRRVLVNAFFWILYLFGYEFMFRGLLFFSTLRVFGLLPAMMINCALYSISHIPKGFGEAFGAVLMGIFLCVIAFNTNSFLIPFVLHIILALGNDLKALSLNDKMRFTLKW